MAIKELNLNASTEKTETSTSNKNILIPQSVHLATGLIRKMYTTNFEIKKSLLRPKSIRTRSSSVAKSEDNEESPEQLLEIKLRRGSLECPICIMFYPSNINYTRCCIQPICTECFLQSKRDAPHFPTLPRWIYH